MKFLAVIVFAASATLPLCVYAADIHTPQPTAFSAKAANVRLNARLAAPEMKPDGTVAVTVSAIIFPNPIEIADVSIAKKQAIPEVDTLIQFTKANLHGSADEIVNFWLPEERASKSALMSQAKIFQANRDFHLKYPGLAFIGVVFQSQTTSVLVRRAGRVFGVTLIKKAGLLYLTDHPSNDLELAVIEASFISN